LARLDSPVSRSSIRHRWNRQLAFTPDEESITKARLIVDGFELSRLVRSFVLDGKMITSLVRSGTCIGAKAGGGIDQPGYILQVEDGMPLFAMQ
jgi:hypothetical protein